MLSSKNPTIALIDSGIGGVSVLRQIISKFKGGNFIYYADNLYMPYGNKTQKFIKRRLNEIIQNLKNEYHVEIIIIACNTASAAIEEHMGEDVIAMKFNKDKTYLTTNTTKRLLKMSSVISDGRLAKQIETNIFNKKKLNKIIKNCVVRHKLNTVKNFVLGCTHYELVDYIFKRYCVNTEIINNSEYLMQSLELNIDLNIVNIKILMSKQDRNLENKIMKLIRG